MATFHLVGCGLRTWQGFPHEVLGDLQRASMVFLEAYTSRPVGADQTALDTTLGRPTRVLERAALEEGAVVLSALKEGDVALMVAGDPLVATTHDTLIAAIRTRGHQVHIHGAASIVTAAPAAAGLSFYKFGRTVSVPYPCTSEVAISPLVGILANHERGLHTLVLLDLDLPGDRFMSPAEAATELLRMVAKVERSETLELGWIVIGDAGTDSPKVRQGNLTAIQGSAWPAAIYCLILPGDLNIVEDEAVREIRGIERGSR